MNPQIVALRAMTKGVYDLQMLRIQAGLRLCANLRAKLDVEGSNPEEVEKKKERAIAIIKASYRRLTDGIASKDKRVALNKLDLSGDPVISEVAEFVLVDQYLALERQEASQFRDLVVVLTTIPIYTEYLEKVVGIGPAMAAVLIAYLDPAKADHVSSFWKYAGLDVVVNPQGIGEGRSRKEHHLVDREYEDKDGELQIRKSVTYDPFVKTKLVGVLGPSFMRSGSPWTQVYYDYKHRLESDPNRTKVTLAQWKRAHKAGEPTIGLWAPGRIHNAATRYMIKMFLQELWVKWRTLEGLPVTDPYAVAKLGKSPHGRAA